MNNKQCERQAAKDGSEFCGWTVFSPSGEMLTDVFKDRDKARSQLVFKTGKNWWELAAEGNKTQPLFRRAMQ